MSTILPHMQKIAICSPSYNFVGLYLCN